MSRLCPWEGGNLARLPATSNPVALLAGLLVLVGCRPPSQPLPEPSAPWRVVTYNIRHGRGMDDSLRLDRTAAVLRRLAPDIVALQEVDSAVVRSGGVDQAGALGTRLGMQAAFGGFFAYQGGAYGMAILSRFPITRVTPIRLPDGNEPRIALAAEVRRPGSPPVIVINVHFDWVASDSFRLPQARALARVLDTLTVPYLLLGDFNDTPGSATLDLLGRGALAAEKPPTDHLTFSSTAPTKEIDFIFAAPRARWRVEQVRVIDEPMASDHRPVMAVLRLQP